ncbi:MAG: hypothetical protein ACJ8G7_01130, partial [Rhizobacter sp.]
MDPEYEKLAPLSEGEAFALWRARHARSGAAVLLKTPRREPPRPEDLAALRGECALAASLETLAPLRPRWAEPGALVFDDPGGALLGPQRETTPVPPAAALAIGEQVAATLAELHRRGAVHRSLQAAS